MKKEKDWRSPHGTWPTSFEKDYLHYIGSHCGGSDDESRASRDAFVEKVLSGERSSDAFIYLGRRINLLEKYIDASAQRKNWGKINGDLAVNFAKAELTASKKLIGAYGLERK